MIILVDNRLSIYERNERIECKGQFKNNLVLKSTQSQIGKNKIAFLFFKFSNYCFQCIIQFFILASTNACNPYQIPISTTAELDLQADKHLITESAARHTGT